MVERQTAESRVTVPGGYYLVHGSDLAMLEGHLIGIYSGAPPLLTPDDMDEIARRFDHIRSRHEQMTGINLDGLRDGGER